MVGAHGLHGALRVALDVPWADLVAAPMWLELRLDRAAAGRLQRAAPELSARARATSSGLDLRLGVRHARATSGGAILALAHLDGREAARPLAGAAVALPPACLPPCAPGEFWCHELAGLAAESEAGVALGRVVEVVAAGGQTLAMLADADGRVGPVPVVSEVVRRVDRAGGRVVLRLPVGLWDLVAGPPQAASAAGGPG